MKFRGIVAFTAAAALIACLSPHRAPAQSNPSGLMSTSSSGLTATVMGVAYTSDGHFVSTEILIKNTSNFRIYVEDAQFDSTQNAILGSGEGLRAPAIINGLPVCDDTYSNCAGSQQFSSIDKFSYVDPGSSLAVSLQYEADQPPSNPDTISFSLTMLARFAKSTDDNSPNDAGPVQEITLSFPFISFSQKS